MAVVTGSAIAMVGGTVSLEYVTVRVAVAFRFEASHEVTVITLTPAASSIPLIDQLVVPVATPLPQRSQVQLTCVTPRLSKAVPLMFSVLEPVP